MHIIMHMAAQMHPYVTVHILENRLSIFCPYMIDTLIQTPSTRQKIAMSTFIDCLLLMLLNHEGAFHGLGGH